MSLEDIPPARGNILAPSLNQQWEKQVWLQARLSLQMGLSNN